jgi:hypothetical protein
MSVIYSVNSLQYEIGSSSFLHAFFSNICFHLENKKWGRKYPYLMKILYKGKFPYGDAPFALGELKETKLKLILPERVIWDIDDLNAQPPWDSNISCSITDLSNYFITSDGKDLIEVTTSALKEGIMSKKDIMIVNL